MEKFNLTQTGQEVQEILDGAAKLSDVNTEKERAELAEEALGASIQQNAEDIDAIEAKIPSDATAENPLTDKEYVDGLVSDESTAREQADETLQGNIDAEETRAKAAEKQNADDIDAIEEKIPSDASSGNQLTTKNYVDNSVATASATFRGTYNLVSDLHLTVDASRSDIASALGNAIANADNNDYAFVQIPTSVDTPTEIGSIERYKFNGSAWTYEYTLNNSGYTAAQWAAINSGITSALVTKLGALPTASELATALLAKQDVLTFDSAPTPGSLNPVTSAGIHTAIDTEKGARQNADAALQQAIEAILVLIPSAASALNQLADKAFVNSSIATNTASFRGTFNLVSDLHLALNASHTDVANALANAISSANNNDYCFVQIPTSVDTPTEIRVTERYKFNGTAWAYEYDLNNSGFTVAQWEAINSAITSALVTKLSALPTAAELAASLDGKQALLTFDNQPTPGSSNPVKSGGVYDVVAAINAKIPSDADAANKMTTEARIATIIGALDATFDLTSADGHITFKMTQTDGLIASVQILTYDIASAAALTTLGGRVSLNESDISNLQAAYAALTQSDIVIVNGTLPSSGQQQNIIYRQLDPDHNPPQFYSDFMWNGTTWVLMAQYNNAIDPRPKKGSQNLVTSGGVFDNMGALDVSELNATETPHTLATYADLSAALAAIPSDYQKGGMSIKFVQTSDNKYVQWRLTDDSWSTTVSDWQGVDDEPKAASNNLVKSGSVADLLKLSIELVSSRFINPSGDYGYAGAGVRHKATKEYYEVEPNTEYVCNFVSNNAEVTAFYDEDKSFISSVVSGTWSNSIWKFTTPSNCKYIRTSHVSDEIPFFFSLKEIGWIYKKLTGLESSTNTLISDKEIKYLSYIFSLEGACEILSNNGKVTEDFLGLATDHNNGGMFESDTYISPNTIYVPSYVKSIKKIQGPGENAGKIICYSGLPIKGETSLVFLGSVNWGENLLSGTKYVRFVATKDAYNHFADWRIDFVLDDSKINTLNEILRSVESDVYINNPLSIDVVPGWLSSDYVTVSIFNNIASVLFDYQSGSGTKIVSTKIGVVSELKNKEIYLYVDTLLDQNNLYLLKNWSADWQSKYRVSGWLFDTIEGGYRITLPMSIYDELEDTDVLYFLQGTNVFKTTTITEYISDCKLYKFTTNLIPTTDYYVSKDKMIVAWGDSLTQGWQQTPYPQWIQDKMPDYNVINCGVGGESITTIMARQGSDVALIPEEIVLPASKETTVTIADGTLGKYLISALDGKRVTPLLQGTGGYGKWQTDSVNPCYINGIECELKKVGSTLNAEDTYWTLQRTVNGDRNITIPAGTPLTFSGIAKYGNAYGYVFFCYQNGGYDNTNDLIMKLKKMVQQSDTNKYIVVGTYTSVDTDREAALQAEFGAHFFNSRVYFSTNAMYDIGLTPTADDLTAMNNGMCPPSLRVAADNFHLNTYGYKALGYMLANLFKSQGL